MGEGRSVTDGVTDKQGAKIYKIVLKYADTSSPQEALDDLRLMDQSESMINRTMTSTPAPSSRAGRRTLVGSTRGSSNRPVAPAETISRIVERHMTSASTVFTASPDRGPKVSPYSAGWREARDRAPSSSLDSTRLRVRDSGTPHPHTGDPAKHVSTRVHDDLLTTSALG